MKQDIYKALNEFKTLAEEKGLQVFSVALKGSQNYNLDDEESDIDANLVFVPTPSQLRSDATYKLTTAFGECTCHNLYSFASIVAKGNPQWIEVCQTEYKVGDSLDMFKHFRLNPSALKGMFMEKYHQMDKIFK